MSECKSCKKKLERKITKSGEIERIGRFLERQFCDRKCSQMGVFNTAKREGVGLKISRALTGRPSPSYGIKRPQVSGVNNHNWKGGITSNNHAIRSSVEYKMWRKLVFIRDDWTCQHCGIRGNQTGGTLNADHIKPFAYFPHLRFNINNGRTLCVMCHRKTDTWGAGNKKAKQYA